MSNEPADKNLGEIFGEFSKTKDTIAQVLAALSRGIADLIKRPFKGLKNRLISLIAILLLLFNPLWGEGIIGFILKQFFGKEPSQVEWLQRFTAWWPYLFVGVVLLALVIMAWEQLTRKPLPPTQFRNPAIKGLLSFEQSDAEIFKKLQREADVQQVMSALTHQNFRFGVLTGVSGCGKTSLLKAGLLPALLEKNHRVVVATLTDEPPLESVQKALSAQLDVRFEGNATNLQTMLDAALQSTESKGFILVLDQFEQFFTQNRTEESRAPFIKNLFTAYQNAGPVRILLSIRLDFMGRLHEIQQLLQYSLNADQNYFNLRKFKPQQAVCIFFVMSEEGKLEAFDESFMLKMTTAELASKEDGLVAAADVQWVATALQQVEGFAFDEKTFQQNGGVQGMMQQYLQKLLETPNAFNLNQEALKVLLAFVDLDNNTRKGRLSAMELRQGLGDQISLDHLASNLEWLTQNRLLHRPGIAEAPNPVWELSHERLIEPLRALANKALTGLDQANLLLNRRVNEWLANGRKNRFLLTRKEYYSFLKNEQYLITEPNKAAKVDLFADSRKRVLVWNRLALAVLVLLLSAWGVYETTWFKVEVLAGRNIEQLALGYHADGRGSAVDILDSLSKSSPRRALDIAGKLGFDEKRWAYFAIWQNIKNSLIKDSIGRKEILGWLLDYVPNVTFVEVADSLPVLLATTVSEEKTEKILYQIKELAEKIEYQHARSRVLGDLAEAGGKMGNSEQGLRFLQQLEQSAQKIDKEFDRAKVLISLIEAVGEMGNSEQGGRFLQQLEQSAQKIRNEYLQFRVFVTLAKVAGKMGDSEQWLRFLRQTEQTAQVYPYLSVEDFVALAEAVKKMDTSKQGQRFLQQAELTAQIIGDESSRTEAYVTLAESVGKMGNSEQEFRFLQQAEQSAQKMYYFRIEIFRLLVEAAGKMGDSEHRLQFLQQLEQSAQKIEREPDLASVLVVLAEASGRIDDSEQRLRFLQQLEKSAQKILSEPDLASVLVALAEVAGKTNNSEQELRFLQQLEQSAQIIGDESSRTGVFLSLVAASEKMGNSEQGLRFLQQAEQSAQKIADESDRANVFGGLAKAAAKIGKAFPEETRRFLSTLESHTSGFEQKSQALAAIHLNGLSQAYADLHDFRKAYSLADQIEDKYPEKVFALIHLQKRYKERVKK